MHIFNHISHAEWCYYLLQNAREGRVGACASANRSAVSLGRLEPGALVVIEVEAVLNVWVGERAGGYST